jgi:hypothetical protein
MAAPPSGRRPGSDGPAQGHGGLEDRAGRAAEIEGLRRPAEKARGGRQTSPAGPKTLGLRTVVGEFEELH